MPADEATLLAAAGWAGIDLDDAQLEQFRTFAGWLAAEAIPAGGLGPREAERLWGRHLADSLSFAAGFSAAPREVLDVGTGVGLPGVPLAIAWPECTVTLLDRGGRRTRLLHRAVRILALENARIARGDVFDVADEWEGVVFRGSVSAPEAVGLSGRLLLPGGTAVLGLSRRAPRPERADDLLVLAASLGLDGELLAVPADLFDGPAWLLIMRLGGVEPRPAVDD